MNKWFFLAVTALCAGVTFAQSRGKDDEGGSSKPNQVLKINEITPLGGESDYLTIAPQLAAKWKLKLNHKDSFKKMGVDGWHYFEVSYQVPKVGTDSAGKKVPILAIPEVEITYALLYDMSKSKHFAAVRGMAKKAKTTEAVGAEDLRQQYALFTETVTYTTVFPGRECYAAVCMPPSAVGVYGEPMIFSVQINVNGTQQGEIKTVAAAGAKIGDKALDSLLVVDRKPAAWWERVQNLSEAVFKVEGVLRDRSATPFALAGDDFYDQVKAQ